MIRLDRTAHRQFFWFVMAGLIVWAAFVRLPFALQPRADGDAALFWLIGHDWLAGHSPYAGLWDVKPPGIFLVHAAAAALFGADPVGGRIVAALAIGLAAAGLYWIGDRLVGNRRAGLYAGLLFPPYSLLLEGLDGKPELIAAPFLIWGIALAVGAERHRLPVIAAGALMGFAAMLKQTAGFEILFVLVVIAATTRSVPRCLTFVAGLAVAPVGFCLYFLSAGAFGAFVDASLFGALARLHGDGPTLWQAPIRLLAILKPALPLLILAGVGWAERRRIGWTGHAVGPALIWGWLAASTIGVIAMRAAYPSYALPLLAPLCLAAARTLAALAQAKARGWRQAVVVMLATAVFCPIVLALYLPDGGAAPLPPRIAAYLTRRVPGRPVYVVDYEPVIYQLSGAPVPTRFPFPQHLLCDFPALPVPAEAEMLRILASRPAALIVSSSHRRMICEDAARVDRLMEAAKRSGYRREARFVGPSGPVEIWLAPGNTDIAGATPVSRPPRS